MLRPDNVGTYLVIAAGREASQEVTTLFNAIRSVAEEAMASKTVLAGVSNRGSQKMVMSATREPGITDSATMSGPLNVFRSGRHTGSSVGRNPTGT